MRNPSEKLAKHNDALNPLLEEVKKAFLKVLNTQGDIAEFVTAVKKLDEFREFINSAEGIGFVVGIDRVRIAVFPLTGDPEKDIQQINLNLPKGQVN